MGMRLNGCTHLALTQSTMGQTCHYLMQMWQLRHREGKEPAQGHSWNPGSLAAPSLVDSEQSTEES